jgi:hypothetical protein
MYLHSITYSPNSVIEFAANQLILDSILIEYFKYRFLLVLQRGTVPFNFSEDP